MYGKGQIAVRMTKNNGVYLYPDELLGWRYDADNAERNAHLFWDNQDLFQIAHETEAGGKRFLFSLSASGDIGSKIASRVLT